ncbi:hypothetical protein WA026_002351 [Henosepilachna vigintioctopunctata]|uniref:Uncharacterized protein n=1 Tax=Henosepilachna vigintioctopunctata TaxID=420089 RepID=A0AAW1TZ76_9CUCU
MQKEWSYFFIGGIRGYLTRYNYQRDKIEFEDRISEMALMDLRATREGPRKVLIILFQDIIGNKHIHVRDAMSALHMRSIGEQMNTHINSFLVKDSSLLFSSKNEILVYNYCDGQYITKLKLPSQEFITFLHKNGNLLLATTSDGFVHAYNFKSMNSVGYIRCDSISLLVVLQDKLIFGSWLKTIKSVTIPKHMLAIR